MVYFGKDSKVEVGDVVRQIPPFSIKYKDVFSLQNLYVLMHELLLEENWLGFDGEDADLKSHADLEALYSENVFQKAIHVGGKEYWVWWRAQKQMEDRTSRYFVNVLDIDWHAVGVQPMEVVHQGKKMKVVHAELEMIFNARIISDIGHKWQNHKLLRHFKRIYEDRIMQPFIEKREKELWREVYRLQSKAKSFLNLRTWAPPGGTFHPKTYGWEAPEQV
jgi:hypothetical protein